MKIILKLLAILIVCLTTNAGGVPISGKDVSMAGHNTILVFNKYAPIYTPLPVKKEVLVAYTKALLHNLQRRNPIEDAKLAIKQGKIFILLQHHGVFDSKNLPTLQSMYDSNRKIKMLSLQGSNIKLNTRIELLNKFELNELNEYYRVMKRYIYYWNRTVITALLERKKTDKRKRNQYLRKALKDNNKLPFITKGGKYEVLSNDLPMIYPKWKLNSDYFGEYYKQLYEMLRYRNPINDAKIALTNRKVFLLSYNGGYRKNQLGLPLLQQLGEKYKTKGIKYHLLQGLTDFEQIKFYEKSIKENPHYTNEYITFKKLVDRYSYYWNRTIIHATVINRIQQ